MAGTLPSIPLSQQFDINGQLAPGALLYFFQVGTVATPQNSYQDFGLTLPNPNPLPADQFGRIPMFYLADGQVHVRMTDSLGVVLFEYPSMQVIGPSSGGGGGGGGTVDPTAIASSGDVKWRGTNETLTGWVKANGTTIGSPTSGATQRANADTQALYINLWGEYADAKCPVAGGRGASALNDFQANKAIGLPDWRGYALVGLDDMGSAAAGRILAGNVTSGGGDGPTTPAASGGEANHTIVLAEMASGAVTLNAGTHHHAPSGGGNFVQTAGTFGANLSGGGGLEFAAAVTGDAVSGDTLTDHAGNGAHNNCQPFVLGTIYLKL